jgi:hypothetical protein
VVFNAGFSTTGDGLVLNALRDVSVCDLNAFRDVSDCALAEKPITEQQIIKAAFFIIVFTGSK